MNSTTSILIAGVFFLAGTVKGVIGLGLPTISIGLLALIMPTVEASALLLMPAFFTNVWQTVAGPSLQTAIRRFWPMMIGICAGTWAGAGSMSGRYASFAMAALGVVLVGYAVVGLAAVRFRVRPDREPWLGPLIGAATGLITAATGLFVVPAVPYLQALNLDKEELVEALGLSFTVSTLALAINVVHDAGIEAATGLSALSALLMAVVGMGIGQRLRRRMHPDKFRRWFFLGLLLLGIYLVLRYLVRAV